MTETVPVTEEVVVLTETMPANENVVKRKTVVYETLVDPTVAKVAAEKLKNKLFVRFGFLKPKPEEIQFVSLDKYYEPYIVISGKYSIDYYRKCIYTVNVNEEVLEVILWNHKFKPRQTMDSSAKGCNMIELDGEERIVNEVKASLILDKSGQEVTLEKLPSAPSEKHPKKILEKFGEEISQDLDLDIIRSKIVRRPMDIKRIVDELFEVNERVVIYTPRFRVVLKNAKTGEEKAVEFDGVTSKRIPQSK